MLKHRAGNRGAQGNTQVSEGSRFSGKNDATYTFHIKLQLLTVTDALIHYFHHDNSLSADKLR